MTNQTEIEARWQAPAMPAKLPDSAALAALLARLIAALSCLPRPTPATSTGRARLS